jgi:hypothetical protein
MASFKVGEAVGLSPVINFNLTDSLMKGAQFGMHEKAAEAKALAARLKKEKIMSLDMSGIHPTLRNDAEDVVYNTTALQKLAADSGQSPMVPFTLGQFQLKSLQARSQRRFDLEKSDPNKYLMDPDAMSLFANGDASGAKKMLEKKGYDPDLINALDPGNVSFLPEKINIAEQIKKDYDPNTKADLYIKKGEAVDMGKGQYYQTMILNPKVAEQAAISIATNQNARLTIMKERPEEYQKELIKELSKTPNEPALAKFRAVQNIIQNPNNPFLPSKQMEVTPSKGSTFNINTGGNINPQEPAGFLVDRDLVIKQTKGVGTYQKQEDVIVKGPSFTIHPQNISLPKASLTPTSGKDPKDVSGAGEYSSGYITSLPINNSDKNINLYKNGKVFHVIKAGQVVDPKYIRDGSLKGQLHNISYTPVALLQEEINSPITGKHTKSYYTKVSEGDTNWFENTEDKNGTQFTIIKALQEHSALKNKEFNLGKNAVKPAEKLQAPSKRKNKTFDENDPI